LNLEIVQDLGFWIFGCFEGLFVGPSLHPQRDGKGG